MSKQFDEKRTKAILNAYFLDSKIQLVSSLRSTHELKDPTQKEIRSKQGVDAEMHAHWQKACNVPRFTPIKISELHLLCTHVD